ncbi:MAG TPA: ankyrin repeat domain-containing protein [Urbifossiella sp.]|nr:ankyrin repeat domain-containing protein [Urbifossiella sp.]
MLTQRRNLERWILGIGALGAISLTLIIIVAINIDRVLKSELIHDAARRNDLAEIGRILDQNPEKLELKNRLGLTPLLEAVWHDNVDAVRMLLLRGANIEATWDLAGTGDGRWTALHIAANFGHLGVAQTLIDAGASIKRRTLKGETPLDIANRRGQGQLAMLLRQKGAVMGQPH